MAKPKIDMCHGPITGPMIRYAIPIFLTALLQRGFQSADMILAGQLGTSGSNAVAAVGATTALTSLLINFFIGCSTGSAVTVAHALGSRNEPLLKKAVHSAMLLSCVIGLALTVIGLASTRYLLTAMSTPAEIIDLSASYLQIYFCSMVPYMVYNFGAAIIRTMGETQKPLFYLLISGPVKLILTVVFVSGCHMDVAGLALATTLSQAVAAVLVCISLFRRKDVCKLELKSLKFSAEPVKRILRLGIPSGIQSATFSLSNVLVQSSVNSLSHLTGFVAGNAAACSIEGLAEVTTGTFYQVALNFTGQNVGANQYGRVKKVYIRSCLLCTLTICVISPLVLLFGRELLGLYIVDSQEAIEWGMVRMTFLFAPLVFQGFMDTSSGVLRGMGISLSGTVIYLLGICGVRSLWLLTVFQIPQYNNPQTLYLIYPLSWILTFAGQFVLFLFAYRKRTQESFLSA